MASDQLSNYPLSVNLQSCRSLRQRLSSINALSRGMYVLVSGLKLEFG